MTVPLENAVSQYVNVPFDKVFDVRSMSYAEWVEKNHQIVAGNDSKWYAIKITTAK